MHIPLPLQIIYATAYIFFVTQAYVWLGLNSEKQFIQGRAFSTCLRPVREKVEQMLQRFPKSGL